MSVPISEGPHAAAPEASASTSLRFDPAKYDHHLTELDLTERERRAVIESLRTIMESFVAWGFGEDSTIAALNARAEGLAKRKA